MKNINKAQLSPQALETDDMERIYMKIQMCMELTDEELEYLDLSDYTDREIELMNEKYKEIYTEEYYDYVYGAISEDAEFNYDIEADTVPLCRYFRSVLCKRDMDDERYDALIDTNEEDEYEIDDIDFEDDYDYTLEDRYLYECED